jgi:hypothetical protein
MINKIHKTVLTHRQTLNKRIIPVNIVEYDKYLFNDELTRIIPNSHILKCSNLQIINNVIFDITNDLTFYSWVGNLGFLKRILILLKFLNFFSRNEIVNKGAWAIDNLSDGYFHWIGDVLPRIESARKHLSNYKIVLPASFEHIEYISSSLNALGIEYLFLSRAGKTIIKDALIISHSAPTGNYNKEVLLQLKYHFDDWTKEITPFNSINLRTKHKIFISRKYANKRKIINENHIIEFMKSRGFKIIYAEKLSFFEQVLLFSDAEIIVGLHGAGLVNMLFMAKGSYLVELRRHGDARNNCFFTMASDLELNYFYLLAEPEGSNYHTGDSYINLCLLSEVINNVERSIRDGILYSTSFKKLQ